ncbi:hypothetical protein [Serratia quinivorans]|uniref:hypothetical protein n=1 Tax=Serratia quinivorans TaxID=137545 RepID=UPI002178D6A9|nr:hypothetical protein [Serratia quinivorans]CAI1965162.1 Uncharacterised protein [Serratia quinivorans]CAI2160983.1 Uncharacterised protein [Serratia quinivorans]
MQRLAVNTFLGVLLGLSGVTAQASDDTSAAIASIITRGPGPVINPENSQYMEEKKSVMAKQAQPHRVKQVKHHGKKKPHAKKYHKKNSN